MALFRWIISDRLSIGESKEALSLYASVSPTLPQNMLPSLLPCLLEASQKANAEVEVAVGQAAKTTRL